MAKEESGERRTGAYRSFLYAMLGIVNLLVVYFLFAEFSALSRDYARVCRENGELRSLLSVEQVVSPEGDGQARLQRYKRYLLDRFAPEGQGEQKN